MKKVASVCLVGMATFADDKNDSEKKKTEIRQMSQQTLARAVDLEQGHETDRTAYVRIRRRAGRSVR